MTLTPGTAVAWNTGNYKANCAGGDITCYNPNGTAPSGLDLVAFDGSTVFGAPAFPGLWISSAAQIKVTFLGKEASATNTAFSLGGGSITNSNGNLGSSYTTSVSAGLLDFAFSSDLGSSAPNGGPITSNAAIAFAFDPSNSSTIYAYFDDSGANVNRDYDDMVVRIEVAAVPLPAGLLLLGTALAGLGMARRGRA